MALIIMENDATLDNAGTFHNDALLDPGCGFTAGYCVSMTRQAVPLLAIVNTGDLRTGTRGAACKLKSARFVNDGRRLVQSGTVNFKGGGPALIALGRRLRVGKLVLAEWFFRINRRNAFRDRRRSIIGGAVTATACMDSRGAMNVTGGSLTSGSGTFIWWVSLTGGTLSVDGVLDVSSSFSVDGEPRIMVRVFWLWSQEGRGTFSGSCSVASDVEWCGRL